MAELFLHIQMSLFEGDSVRGRLEMDNGEDLVRQLLDQQRLMVRLQTHYEQVTLNLEAQVSELEHEIRLAKYAKSDT
jgi:hypothetical protein